MKKKRFQPNIIEEAINLAAQDQNDIVTALSIIGTAMMDNATVYVPVMLPKDWETYRTKPSSDYLLNDSDGTSWLPVFTRQSDVTQIKDAVSLKASLMNVMKYAYVSDQMEGLVINPHRLQMKFPKELLKALLYTINETCKQLNADSD